MKTGKKLKSSRRRPLDLSKSQIENALLKTETFNQAANYLNVHRLTLKKYVILHFGEEFYKENRNYGGKGVPKQGHYRKKDLNKILAGEYNGKKLNIHHFQRRVITEGIKPESCELCGYSEQRIIDFKCPLLIDFLNDDRTDYRLENLRFLCYNCYFINVGNLHGTQPKIETLVNPLTGEPVDDIFQFRLEE